MNNAIHRSLCRLSRPHQVIRHRGISMFLLAACFWPAAASGDDEAYLFTPPGFDVPGKPLQATGEQTGRLKIVITDKATGEPTFCRMNVVGPDGNYYQPKRNYLTPFALTGQWPKTGRGNRVGKAPIRYYGRFFYSWGEITLDVPPGPVRVEVWKGFEYRPQTVTTRVETGKTAHAQITLEQTMSAHKFDYYSGDPHIHIPRVRETDDQTMLDLMEAEGIRFGSILAYNEPAGPYSGFMKRFDTPQFRGLGKTSIRQRGDFHIVSGQEYRSNTYGHLNLFLRDDIVLKGIDVNANDWPLYGSLGRETQQRGGYAFYAHGGYAKAIYADFVQGDVNGVELLQFGVYRGIGLNDWYDILNIGYRFPAIGASDYPACRKLGDCKTYVNSPHKPTTAEWFEQMAQGKSFVTTGPMLLLEVDGQKPGMVIRKVGNGPHAVKAHVRVRSDVAPVTHVQLIVNGSVAEELVVPSQQGKGRWLELTHDVELNQSSWIAARAFSNSSSGSPDAEAHTNPVTVSLDGKAPYQQAALDRLVSRIDGQITAHKKREFDRKSDVLAYFERSRDILMKIRAAEGVPVDGHPADIVGRELDPLDKPGAKSHSEEQLKAFLKPVPPKSPDEARKTIETIDGFEMQLVAHEPLVVDPVAAAFDENGQLYVAEMRDYPYFPKPGAKPIGTIRLLRDTDGDGRFDESHIFADELLWTGGVTPWKGGVFVASPPDIWYLKDTDGDYRADVKRKVFTGFGTKNQQAMLNNLKWGLDHKVYGSTAGNGGTVRPGNDPEAEGISVDRRDFRFDPNSEQLEAITGTVQFGNDFDDWGNRFLCSESRPLLHAVLPQRYLARNPHLPVPSAIQNIAGGPVPIFRISPIERWRHIRSSRRIEHKTRPATSAGASHHVIDAAAGVTIYRGGAYPKEFSGNVFIGGAQNNVIHRMKLTPTSVTFQSHRADENTEFARSSDNWFRPVNFVNAPDGTLYVLDMSREILESIHIPNDVVKHLDLTSGRKNGRIYRIAPAEFESPAVPKLGSAAVRDLVAALEHPNGWWRDTAHRLVFERQDLAAVEPLRKLLRASPLPQARLHALWSLHGLNSLTDEDLAKALSDDSNGVREHAIRLSESRLDTVPALLERVRKLASDENPRIALQVAFSLGETSNERASETLANIAEQHADDVWIRTAVLSSSAAHADRLFDQLLSRRSFAKSATGIAFLNQLMQVVGARNRTDEIRHVLATLAGDNRKSISGNLTRNLVLALGQGLKRADSRLADRAHTPDSASALLDEILDEARATAADSNASVARRKSAIALLSCFSFDETADLLVGLLEPRQPELLQLATMQAVSEYDDLHVPKLIFYMWRQLTPTVRVAAIRALLSREAWTKLLLEEAASGELNVTQIDETQRSLLLKHRNREIASLAEQLFGDDALGPRKVILDDYRTVLTQSGNRELGQKIFERECMVCHRVGDVGHAIGPNLAASPSRDPEALLMHVLDPNRYVLPNYMQYVVLDMQGRTHTGMITSQTATSVTLKREKNETETILRTSIDELVSTGKSLMPEGLEKKITKAEMSDLIAFLSSLPPAKPADAPVLEIGTLPGLIEP